jgi:alcohol dehydrogenase class IV
LANAILLPPVLAFNALACEDKLARVATALGEAASEAVQRLSAEVEIPLFQIETCGWRHRASRRVIE